MKFSVFLICVLVVVLAIGFVEWVAKKVLNQDDDDDWGGHCQY
jgi:protein unc-50